MTTAYTALLGLAQPVPGELTGTWGTVVNDNITAYLDAAVAGAQIISGTQTAVTLSKTTGTSLSQAGTGATGSSQYQIIRCTGNPASLLTITAPAADKTYIIINATSTSQSVKIVGAGPTTGVTILSGKTSLVAWNGTDFVEVSPSTATTATNLASGSAGTIPYQSASGTTAMLAAGTSGQVLTSAGAAAPTWSTPAAATKTISNKTGAYTVVSGDLGKIINCTSGTFTVSLTAAASLGSGFTCIIWNTSNTASNVITIDPAGTETIDGKTTLTLQRGEGLAIVCDGANWQTDDKKPMRAYVENISNTETRSAASADNSIAIGIQTTASGQYSFAIGTNYGGANTASGAGSLIFSSGGSTASGNQSMSIGSYTVAGSNYSTALGINSASQGSVTATGAGAMALGGSYASGIDSFAAAIANNTSSYGATGANSVAIGSSAYASNQKAVAIGHGSVASAIYSIAIGYSSNAGGSFSTAIMAGATNGNGGTAIGMNSGLSGSVTGTASGAMALGGSYASGTDSFAAAIANNTSTYGATGANGIAMGYQAKASTPQSISIGSGSQATGSYATAVGYNVIASGYGAVCLGWNASAIGQNSIALGARSLSTEYGKYAFASGQFAAQGDAQHGRMVLRVATTTATPTALTSDGSAASTTNQVILSTYGSIAFSAIINAKSDSTGENAGFKLEGVLNRNFGVGSVRVVGTISKTVLGKDTGAALWDVNATADTTNGGLAITVTGKASTNIRWVASVTFVESNF